MRETKKIKLEKEEIEICLKMEDGEEEIDPNIDVTSKKLEDTVELNFEDLYGQE